MTLSLEVELTGNDKKVDLISQISFVITMTNYVNHISGEIVMKEDAHKMIPGTGYVNQILIETAMKDDPWH